MSPGVYSRTRACQKHYCMVSLTCVCEDASVLFKHTVKCLVAQPAYRALRR